MTAEVKCGIWEMRDVATLVENPRNDNDHKPEHAEWLAKFMQARGIRHPIIVSRQSGFIVAGHLRLAAARLLGLKQYPVELQDFQNEADEYAFLSGDNNLARYAELNEGKLIDNLKQLEIDPETFDFGELGLYDFNLDIKEVGLPDLGDGSDPDIQQVTFTLSNEQKDFLDEAMEKAKVELDCTDEINQNKNGNQLAAILRHYVNS